MVGLWGGVRGHTWDVHECKSLVRRDAGAAVLLDLRRMAPGQRWGYVTSRAGAGDTAAGREGGCHEYPFVSVLLYK